MIMGNSCDITDITGEDDFRMLPSIDINKRDIAGQIGWIVQHFKLLQTVAINRICTNQPGNA